MIQALLFVLVAVELVRLWKEIEMSAEVTALVAQVAALVTAANAAVAALQNPGLSAADKAALVQATTDVQGVAAALTAATPHA